MEFATGALGSLLPKLAKLLQGEYKLHKHVEKNIAFLKKEIEYTHAALRSAGEVPQEQLTELVRIWARDARELSYDMEDAVDRFLVCVEGPDPPSKRSSKRFIQKMKKMLAIGKRHQIGEQIEDVKKRAVELAARRDRYKVDTVNTHVTSVDPRINALYAKTTELVGIDEAREEIIMKLTNGDDGMSMQQQKIVSIVGIGGLGKTTLAKAVYDELKMQFNCTAFVTVSRNPDMIKFLKDMLYKLDNQKYENIHSTSSRDVTHLIDLVRMFICNKRYLIVIDDIWDVNVWKMIKYALPDNKSGCKIITTTRILSVGEQGGDVYKLKPLSLQNSRNLLYKRVFGTKSIHDNEDMENCPYEDLAIVSDKILKKCAGVPLAISTIASLLASKGKNKLEWYDVYNSIGTGMENSLDVENMRKILSYSYYDLTPHHRTCLLYLSVFPEDFEIEKDRLIWLWIAEGFVRCEEPGKSLFILGESYFNELINRSMIQPVSKKFEGNICCRVHDMVLDLIRFISSEENFVTVLSNMDHAYGSTMIRRLSIQKDKVYHAYIKDIGAVRKVRSVVCFLDSIHEVPSLGSFRVLRVLDLEGCKSFIKCTSIKHVGNSLLLEGYKPSLEYVGNLFHLRYLSLKDTYIEQLPEEIGNLQFLESLDVRGSYISRLPLSVGQVKCLLHLGVGNRTKVPKGILGSLRSLEDLSELSFPEDGAEWMEADTIEELGLLTKLRVLKIFTISDNNWNKMVECLQNLRNIQELVITCGRPDDNVGVLDGWVAPRHLRRLETKRSCWFSRLPSWMSASHRLDLCYLHIAVKELQQEDLEVLGRLPTLCDLNLQVAHENLGTIGRFVLHAGSFPCLVKCWLSGFIGPPMVFQQGAMSRLIDISFDFYVREARGIAGSDGGFDLGLANLPSLQEVNVVVVSKGASNEEMAEAMVAVGEVAETHPNGPTFRMHTRSYDSW